ncbi:MAG: hypothetical protein M3033_00110 [Acidobacteriota bacterium]|nr:hypothetical protein [Acidobacteriota bacterium]
MIYQISLKDLMSLSGNTITTLGCVFVVVTSCYIYRAAKNNNHNATRWIFINLAVGIVFQFVLPLLIAATLVTFIITLKGSPRDIDKIYGKYGLIVDIIILVLNLVGIWLIIKHVSKSPQNKISVAPPMPPKFDQDG